MASRRLILVALGAQVAAFWPVWGWYARRTLDPSDEPWGLLALAVALVLGLRAARRAPAAAVRSLGAAGAFTLVYAAAYPALPPLGRALLALSALGATLASLEGNQALHPARLVLFGLATPLLSTLQFVAAYPLRVVSGEAAAWLLRLSGLEVLRDGALLSLGSTTVYVDAPCSGVRMLWAGMFLAAVVSWRLRPLRALACLAAAAGAVLAGNALRSAALFYPESGLIALPAGAHDAIGLITFAPVAMAVVATARRLQERPCAA